MTTQQEVDALTTKVGEVEDNLKTTAQELQTELDSLEQQIKGGTPAAELDLTKLQGALDKLNTYAGEVGQLRPTEPGSGAAGQAPTSASGSPQEHTEDPAEAAQAARDRV